MVRSLLLAGTACLGLWSIPLANVTAQDRGIVRLTVVDSAGNVIPYARVRAIAPRNDTTVRATEDGQVNLALRFGTYRIAVNMIGFQQFNQEITVSRPESRYRLTMQRAVQQLATVAVNASWIGVRGIVGDTALSRTLANVKVRGPSGDLTTMTDSSGRFQIALDDTGSTVLLFERDGYRRRTMTVDVKAGGTRDVIVLLAPGKDRNITAANHDDLSQRLRWMGSGGIIITRAELLATRAPILEDAMIETGLLPTHGLSFMEAVCVYENGEPQVNVTLSQYRVQSVEFVEVWRRDETRTLGARWPKGEGNKCGRTRVGNKAGTITSVSVWLRR